MVFISNSGAGAMLAPAAMVSSLAKVGFIPVCGAMRRNHLIKE